MRRRVREEEATGQWPPEHLRHFRLEDWPGLLPNNAEPSVEECAVCAYWAALDLWSEQRRAEHPDEARDPVACCPEWPACGFAPPDDYFHKELI